MADESREFVWINTDWLHDDRVRSLGVHAEVLLIELATFAARGDPPARSPQEP